MTDDLPHPPLINRAAVEPGDVNLGDIVFSRRRIGAAAGCAEIGVSLYAVPAGARQMPLHAHGDEEEIVHVLAGSGLSIQGDASCAVRAGDTVVHRPAGPAHTLIAGDDGLELIVFGTGSDSGLTYLPRAKVMWAGPRWIPPDGPSPFRAEAAAGRLTAPEPGDRPANVVGFAAVPAEPRRGRQLRRLGRAAGAVKSGLNHIVAEPGEAAAGPPHVHSLEEEFLYVLDGSGTLTLGAAQYPLTIGDAVARPPGTGVAHTVVAGSGGLTLLLYGTQRPDDAVYFPERGQVRLGGLGVWLDVSAQG